MHATSIDSLSDCIATSSVIIGVVIGMLTGINLDAYIGIIVACFVIVTGFKSAAESLNPLIGEAPDSEFVAEIEKLSSMMKEFLACTMFSCIAMVQHI